MVFYGVRAFSYAYLHLMKIRFQVPSNLLVSRVRPRWFLPTCVVCWGVLVCLMSLTNTYKALYGFRILLGTMQGVRIFCIASILTYRDEALKAPIYRDFILGLFCF